MNPKLQIIGLSGTNGSGKDTVGQILAEHHGYLFVSVTDILRNELQSRKLEVTRQNLRALSAEWRRESGLGVLIDTAVEQYQKVKDSYQGLVVGSLRNSGEADRIHELGGTVVWTDADPRVRYDRIQANAAARARAGEDAKSFKEFLAEEQAEMHRPEGADEATLNISAVKSRSDITIHNDSNDLEEFRRLVEQNLGL